MHAISVENLTKRYDLGVIGTGTISRDLNRWWARVRKQPDPYTRIGQKDAFARIGESILALDDVSFSVSQGEALGIIGRNGAGKSTLLKILSRVTAPTSGVVKVKGRIGSLLEVGTGFHPELTGRENVYLNGAILGMKKEEVTRKFDEIVSFAGVEKFIDTPVKRYSSGMYVRLAFAVAAHLDPEILIVDEVLAVGDAEFQKKCLGKMGDVAGEGRTVLFVSHNMGAIKTLCQHGLLLENGRIAFAGLAESAVNMYLSGLSKNASDPFSKYSQRSGDGPVKFTGAQIRSKKGQPIQEILAGDETQLEFNYYSSSTERDAYVCVTIFTQMGVAITNLDMSLTNTRVGELSQQGRFICNISKLPLMPGKYHVAASIYVNEQLSDLIENILVFDVVGSHFFKNGNIPNPMYCTFMVDHHWNHLGE